MQTQKTLAIEDEKPKEPRTYKERKNDEILIQAMYLPDKKSCYEKTVIKPALLFS